MVAHRLGVELGAVTIRQRGGAAGHTDVWRGAKAGVEHLVMCLAGREAEALFGAVSGCWRTSGSDYREALATLRERYGPMTEAERSRVLAEARGEARRLVLVERARIYRVARLLIEAGTLEGLELELALGA